MKIRIYGDPVLKEVSEEVANIDGALVKTCNRMLDAMYNEPGLGLAAPQVGIGQRFFVYDLAEQGYGEGPAVLINPEVVESRGEWAYDEGCLSVPELSWEIIRPREIHIKGYDIDGNEVSIEADDLLARLFLHELDHLDGVLLLDHLDDDQRREAKKILRDRTLSGITGRRKRGPDLGDDLAPGTSSGGLALP